MLTTTAQKTLQAHTCKCLNLHRCEAIYFVAHKQIKPAARLAALGSEVGWHAFRHTYSSMLRQLGVDMKVQQELLRHADIRITMNVYTQAVSEEKRAAHSKVVRMVLAYELSNEPPGHFWTRAKQ